MEKDEKKKKKDFKETWYYLKKTYPYAKKDKKYLFFFFLGCIVLCAIQIVAPIFTARQIIELTNEAWQQLFWVTLAILGIEVLRNFVRKVNNFFINRFFYSVRKNIQLEVARETLKLTTETLNTHSSGVFIERISNDTSVIAEIFMNIIDYVTYIISAIGVLVSISFLNMTLFLLYVGFLIILFVTKAYAQKVLKKKRRLEREKSEVASGFVSEMVRGAKDIKILNAETSFLSKANDIVNDLNQASYDYTKTRRNFVFWNGNIRDLLDFFIILCGIYFLMSGQLEVATMIVIFNYRNNILAISDFLEGFLELIQRYTLAAERIFEVIDSPKFPKEVFGSKQVKKLEGHIKFQNVSFQYDDSQEVLNDVSFEIKPNETVSFVGKSGAGKSTIFNLIAGLYHVNQGSIYLDGIPVEELSKESLRGNLSIISQNPYIFNMSIRENLTIIKHDLTEEEMVLACKRARLHDFIMTLKDGYDTIVGESGVTLSGGQRQRLAIARALIQKTEIILFDEATSALDNETQAEIQQSIHNMQGEYTILIIAHRLSTVINSDRLILIDQGKVKGIGTHQELLEHNAIYKKLYELELSDEEKSKQE